MNVLLIGYGSIGRRHAAILSDLAQVRHLTIVSKQNIPNFDTIKSLDKVSDLMKYDYFIIASETSKHFSQLEYLLKKVERKVILVEKPVFDQTQPELQVRKNKVYTAYNLRFHSLLRKLKSDLKEYRAISVSIRCGQYLPTWRPDLDYRQTYSASSKGGGGVLRDLSHELDYLIWLFGDIDFIYMVSEHASDLEIDSDDVYMAIGKTKEKVIFNLSLDYLNKVPLRKIDVQCNDVSIHVDLVSSEYKVFHKNGDCISNISHQTIKNETYKKMHQAVLNADGDILCSLEEGLKVVDIFGAKQQLGRRGC